MRSSAVSKLLSLVLSLWYCSGYTCEYFDEIGADEGEVVDFKLGIDIQQDTDIEVASVTYRLSDYLGFPDDEVSDSLAFEQIIERIGALPIGTHATILLEPGVYVLDKILKLDTSNVTIIGSDSLKTRLAFKCSIPCLERKQYDPEAFDRKYSWKHGALEIGCTGSCSRLSVSHYAMVSQKEGAENELAKTLLGVNHGDITHFKRTSRVYFAPTDKAQKALLHNLRSVFSQAHFSIKSGKKEVVDSVSLENLVISFPQNRYQGHFKEEGENAIYSFDNTRVRLRNIVILNSENGILHRGDFGLFTDITIIGAESNTLSHDKYTGHHAIALLGSNNTAENIRIKTPYHHGLSLNGLSQFNSVAHLSGTYANLDFHRGGVAFNAFFNIDLSRSRRPFASGGKIGMGNNLGSGNVFVDVKVSDMHFEMLKSNSAGSNRRCSSDGTFK